MTFNRKIDLVTLTPSAGNAPPVESARKSVWANISDAGVITKFNAAAVGKRADLQAVCWRSEYFSPPFGIFPPTHCYHEGVLWRVQETGKTKNPLHVKVIFSRGG
ncbi:MAG: hypothetical protein LBI38_07070 [Oscillospiraceae bacterium]|jgi:hypothetical protein|nr:hypothetical protein [Oscillospiraceae bacterium]